MSTSTASPSFTNANLCFTVPPTPSTPICPAPPTANLCRSNFFPVSHPPARHPAPVTRTATTITASVQTPDYFSTHWYYNTITPLDIDISAHHIPNPDTNASPPVDHHFFNPEARVLALVDYAVSSPHASLLLQDIRHSLLQNAQLYGHQPRLDLRRALSTALLRHGAPPRFSAMAMQFDCNVMRAAWAGACGFIVIRNDKVWYRSYQRRPPRDALEHVLAKAHTAHSQCARRHWLKWGGRESPTATGGYVDGVMAGLATQAQTFSLDCEEVCADFIELEDNDLIVAATDGFFSNVSEEQILAFVRPVPDAEDKTLAIANHTCLGSWRRDDVDFIAYYLASIALNFATATNSTPLLPFPFPPSPHVDDITVMCVACSFQS